MGLSPTTAGDPLVRRFARTGAARATPAPDADATLAPAARELFDLAPVPMQVVDADGVVVAVNAASARTFGRSAEELVGTHVGRLTHPADLGEELDVFRRLVAGEIPRYSVRKRFVTGFGEVIWTLTTATRFAPGRDGRPQILAQVQNLTGVPGFVPPAPAAGTPGSETSTRDAPGWESAAFLSALDRQLARGRDRGERAALLVVDLGPQDAPGGPAPRTPSLEQRAAIDAAIRGRLRRADVVGHIAPRQVAAVLPSTDLPAAMATGGELVPAIVEVSSGVRSAVPLRVTAVAAALPASGGSAEQVLERLTRVLVDARRDGGGHAVVEVAL